MDRAVIVISAMILNAAIAGPKRFYDRIPLPRAGRFAGGILRTMERKLNRENRSAVQRRLRGIVIVSVTLLASLALGLLLARFFKYNAHFLEIFMLSMMLPVRQSWDIASGIHKALKNDNTAAARACLDKTLWRHHAFMDTHSVARAAIELLAVHFSEKILAPAFWYIFLGLPGFFVSKASYLLKETMVQPLQIKHGGDSAFGTAALAVHYVYHYLPSRTAALLYLSTMVFLPSSRPLEAAQAVIGGDIDTGTPEQAALLAEASVLGLALGGPTSVYTDSEWQGSGRAKATPADIRSALYLFALLHLFIVVLFGLFL